MLTALVLVCSLAATPDLAACTTDNAIDVMRVPEQFGSPVTCALYGQAYVAQTAMGAALSTRESVKILCVPSDTKAARTARVVPIRSPMRHGEVGKSAGDSLTPTPGP
jgi:hypothetical protein